MLGHTVNRQNFFTARFMAFIAINQTTYSYIYIYIYIYTAHVEGTVGLKIRDSEFLAFLAFIRRQQWGEEPEMLVKYTSGAAMTLALK